MDLGAFLIDLIIIGAVFWAARALIAVFKIEEPAATIIYVVLVLVVIVWLVGGLTLIPLRLRH